MTPKIRKNHIFLVVIVVVSYIPTGRRANIPWGPPTRGLPRGLPWGISGAFSIAVGLVRRLAAQAAAHEGSMEASTTTTTTTMIYGKILENYMKHMPNICPKWAHNGPFELSAGLREHRE